MLGACVANAVSSRPDLPGPLNQLCTHLPACIGSFPPVTFRDGPCALELHPFCREPEAPKVAFSQCPVPVKTNKPRILIHGLTNWRCHQFRLPLCDQAASGISPQLLWITPNWFGFLPPILLPTPLCCLQGTLAVAMTV